MYCLRQKHYRSLMTRIQAYIVGLKIHDKKPREEDEFRRDPFGTKDDRKITNPESLAYKAASPNPTCPLATGGGGTRRHRQGTKDR